MNTESATPKLDKNDPDVIVRAYKFALKPTASQEQKLRQHTGGARFVYNYLISRWRDDIHTRIEEKERGVSEDELKLLVEKVEANVRSTGASEIPSNEVGLAILGPLRELDEVAYLRFASVYKSFTSLEDFEKEMASLRHDHEHTEADNAGYEDL